MADFIGLLKKKIETRKNPTPQFRNFVYQRAREAVMQKLNSTGVPKNVLDSQLLALENAIQTIEQDYDITNHDYFVPPARQAPSHDEKPDVFNDFVEYDPTKLTTTSPKKPLHPSSFHRIFGKSPTTDKKQQITSTQTSDSPILPAENLPNKQENGAEDKSSQQKPTKVDPSILDGDIITASEKPDQKDSKNALGNSSIADFDPVSDIFVQAEKRKERKAARQKFTIIAVSIFVLVSFFITIIVTGWSVLGKKTTILQTAKDIISAQSNKDVPATPKLTQRLMPDGTETNPALESASQTSESDITSTTTPPQGALSQATGEAVYYEPRTANELENVERGTVTWSLIKQPEQENALAIRGDLNIPQKNVSLRLTIRRNDDATIPAAYLAEIVYSVPEGFPGRSINQLEQLTFKASEQSVGQTLKGASQIKVANNVFVYALSNMQPFIDNNLHLIKKLSWIRLVTKNENGRIGELTFSKGKQGQKIFDQVVNSWLDEHNKTAEESIDEL